MLNNIKFKNSFFIWGLICVFYLLFIGILSWVYPYGGDELRPASLSLIQDIKNFIFKPIMALRIGCFLEIPILHTSKILYVILNPFAQIGLIFSAFYFIYMRFPRFNNLKDLSPFILILSLGTFFIVQPSDTLLWIGGATNYAWVFIAFIWFLIYLRKLEEGKIFTQKYFPFLCIFWGLFLGMMNENNSPMVLCLMLAFCVYAYFKKIVLRKDFWILFIFVILGLYILFALGGNDIRLKIISFGFPMKHTIPEKLFMHLHRINSFLFANLFLAWLLPIFFGLLCWDKGKLVLKNKNFYLSILCWGVASGLAISLFFPPLLAARAFFSATWFCIFSLIFLIITIQDLYKVKLIKYFAFLFLVISLYIAPLFALGVYTLHNNVAGRQIFIDNAKKNGRDIVYVGYIDNFYILSENLTTGYNDTLRVDKIWSKIEGIKIKSELGDNVLVM